MLHFQIAPKFDILVEVTVSSKSSHTTAD